MLSSGLLWGASSAAGAGAVPRGGTAPGCAARRHKTTILPLVGSQAQMTNICPWVTAWSGRGVEVVVVLVGLRVEVWRKVDHLVAVE